MLVKLKEFKWAIEDLYASIRTGKYPSDNVYKLYQRLAKAHECLQEYDLAINSYKLQYDSMRTSKLSKTQKLQMKSDIQKSLASCKKFLATKNFTAFESAMPNSRSVRFPTYHEPHAKLQNTSGRNMGSKMAYIIEIKFEENKGLKVLKYFSRCSTSHTFSRTRSFCSSVA